MDVDPPQSRLFVVCGRAIEADALQVAFQPFGNLQNVKLVKDKGVAYVKYDKASSAAFAMEHLNGAVLNNGRGPKLKVMLAEAPTARGMTPSNRTPEPEMSSDPDNIPPRSRLFVVVPKQADAQQIQDHMCQYEDLEYCKTDLISAKGVVFCKFHKSSSALKALEDVTTTGTLAGYKVKCMLAEPKSKRRADSSPQDIFGHMSQAAKLEYGLGGIPVDTAMQLKLPMGAGLNSSMSMSDPYASIGGLAGLAGGLGGFQLSGVNNLADVQGLGAQVGLGFGGLGHLQGSPVSPNNNNSPGISRQRLFVVVHKGVSEDVIARLFRRFPGMEYCDLKKDRATGKSKGFCYINYSTQEAAAVAIDQLNGAEFPPHSGHRIKVMYAEPMGVHASQVTSRNSPMSNQASPSPMHTPLSRNMSPDVVSVQDTLASMSVQRVASQNANLDQVELAARMVSPVSSTGAMNNMAHSSPGSLPARELMFSVA